MHSAEDAYRELYAAIVDQRLSAGARLTETTLAQVLSCSRRHIDKALWRLAEQRLVQIRRNAGAWVAAPSFQEAREIYELRLIVETAVVRKLCAVVRPDGLKLLKQNLDAENRARRLGDQHMAVRLSGEFHIILARLSHSLELERQVEGLVARTSLVTQLYANPNGLGCWHHQHDALIERLASRDADRAAELMEKHLRELESSLRVESPASRHDELKKALLR
ncbi:MAG: GntR family transcriptional regulator [Hydrogenophaga sp.]|jgi:DNA-binding GntR family transcriptional regulator|nr:GntR family transcriptional regulator [Hydrogenophaga sp.]